MRRLRLVAALAAALVLSTGAPAEAAAWRGPFKLTWYGPGYYGNRTACGKRLTRELRGVATWLRIPCGTLIELRWHHHRVVVPVVDRMPPRRDNILFDATPWVACHGLNGPRLQGTCFTRTGVHWRLVHG